MTDRSSDANKRFAADLTRLRISRGWSVEELAERSQLDLAELESILGGEGEVPLDAIILLSRALSVAPGDLIDGTAGRPDDD
jgi:transcriptional regulator with XRE-family HTH domain